MRLPFKIFDTWIQRIGSYGSSWEIIKDFGVAGLILTSLIGVWTYIVQTIGSIHELGWGVWPVLGLLLTAVTVSILRRLISFIDFWRDRQTHSQPQLYSAAKTEASESKLFLEDYFFYRTHNEPPTVIFNGKYKQDIKDAVLFLDVSHWSPGLNFSGFDEKKRIRLAGIKHATRGEPIKIQLYTIEKEVNKTMTYWGEKDCYGADDIDNRLLLLRGEYRCRLALHQDGNEQHIYFVADTANGEEGKLQVTGLNKFSYREEWESDES